MDVQRFLVILEVSQKQAYIFSSNKVRENIRRSARIAYVTSPEFFADVTEGTGLYRKEDNFIYSGGGHTMLEFATLEEAKAFNRHLTAHVYRNYPGLELFSAIAPYNPQKGHSSSMAALTQVLEEKKSRREAVFHQGSFGVESVSATTREAEEMLTTKKKEDLVNEASRIQEIEERVEKRLMPEGFRPVYEFEKLGLKKGDSSYIAVVHIDGNGMGKRAAEFYAGLDHEDWSTFKKRADAFSKGIDDNFKAAFEAMNACVARQIENGGLNNLNIFPDGSNFPVRRIISSGDDICFVTDGRIGIEAAVAFINALASQVNPEDHKGYSACAGVALVHGKYPFFKAYELAEELCGNAKRYGASLCQDLGLEDNGAGISAIDWHLEQGEVRDTLEEIREGYTTGEGNRLELRPLFVRAKNEDMTQKIKEAEPFRRYQAVKKLLSVISREGDESVRSKLKEMRSYLKQGEGAAKYYVAFHKLQDIILSTYQDIFKAMTFEKIGTGEGLERKLFAESADGKRRCLIFDAVEIMDTYIPFRTEDGEIV